MVGKGRVVGIERRWKEKSGFQRYFRRRAIGVVTLLAASSRYWWRRRAISVVTRFPLSRVFRCRRFCCTPPRDKGLIIIWPRMLENGTTCLKFASEMLV